MTSQALKELIGKYRPSLIFLSETRMKDKNLKKVRNDYKFPFDITVKPIRTAGGLALWWDHSVTVQVLSKSKNMIDTIVQFKSDGSLVRFTWFYGPPNSEGKPNFWRKCRHLARGIDLPWLCIGDFNEFLWPHEKDGGNPWNPSKRRFLREFMEANDLIDIQFKGQKYTWSNNWPGGGLIKIRLDRGIVNTKWLERWLDTSVFHFPKLGSDHCLLIFDTEPPLDRGPKSFKFEPSWVDYAECKEVISKAWDLPCDGTGAVQWVGKIDRCARDLSSWSKLKFSNNRKTINSHIEELQLLQDSSFEDDRRRADTLIAEVADL
ncbi:hypothetical protein ACLB2K_062964 [Fragaria x ananassa]